MPRDCKPALSVDVWIGFRNAVLPSLVLWAAIFYVLNSVL